MGKRGDISELSPSTSKDPSSTIDIHTIAPNPNTPVILINLPEDLIIFQVDR